jgi:recombination protein RecR
MDSLHKLAEYFGDFPGIGPRQAKRFVYYLLTRGSRELEDISRLILEIKKNVRVCDSCFRFYTGGTGSTCAVCSDAHRDTSQLMIVARDVDFESIEKSHTYSGMYFILGGTIPILEKEPEKRVRLMELKNKIEKAHVAEIILSLNLTTDGENTSEFIEQFIKAHFPNIKISHLGRGLSTGSELEYVDAETIKNALKNRN